MTAAEALDPRALAQVTTRPENVRAYLRQVFIPGAAPPDPLYVQPSQPSRWQTRGGTLYLAEDEPTVWAEYCRSCAADIAAADPTGGVGIGPDALAAYIDLVLEDPVPDRALFEVRTQIDRLADLTSAYNLAVLAEFGISRASLLHDDFGVCPAIAEVGAALGWDAIRASSAALDGGICLAMMPGAHPPPAVWTVLRPRARPNVGIAYFTRYRAGERPRWLDGYVG